MMIHPWAQTKRFPSMSSFDEDDDTSDSGYISDEADDDEFYLGAEEERS